MARKIYETKKELEKDLAKRQGYAFKKGGEITDISNLIEAKKERVNRLYDRKKEILNDIRELIRRGKEHRNKRNELHSKSSPKNEIAKEYKKEIDELKAKVSRLKDVRDRYNKRAKGKVEYLERTVLGQFKTLITMEMSLKEEIYLFNMIFEMRERIKNGKKGNEYHRDMLKTFEDLKEKQNTRWNAFQEINKTRDMAQVEHFASLEKFKKKEALSKELDAISDEIKNLKQEINDLYLTIEAVRIAKGRVEKEAHYLKSKTHGIKGDKIRLTKREQLTLAKDKLKKEQKMGLEDLKLLLSSGSLNDNKGKRRKKR